jgi:hypothetical protein
VSVPWRLCKFYVTRTVPEADSMRPHHVCAAVLCFLFALGAVSRTSAQDASPGSSTLEVLVTTAPSLPQASRAAMIEEATAIWRRERVTLEWLPGTARRPPSPDLLRLLVLPKGRPGATSESATLVVAELVRPENGRPLAIASIEVAERIVRDTASPSEPAAPDPHRVGLVLGRAVAHEIGHFLLNTRTHAPIGLMRARFDMREFADPRSSAFLLDPETAVGLSDRALRSGRITAVTPLREAVGVSPTP